MSIEQLKNQLMELSYAKDIQLNLATLFSEEGAPDLTSSQLYLLALASAYTTKNNDVIQSIAAEASHHLTPNEINAAKIAATLMAMNNIYYRFTHLVSDKSYANLPARLRMNSIANPGIDKMDFELVCLAVSAMNGCGLCIDAHTRELSKAGASALRIQSAIRIAAIIHATAMGIAIAHS